MAEGVTGLFLGKTTPHQIFEPLHAQFEVGKVVAFARRDSNASASSNQSSSG
jgi:hypothetical protein